MARRRKNPFEEVAVVNPIEEEVAELFLNPRRRKSRKTTRRRTRRNPIEELELLANPKLTAKEKARLRRHIRRLAKKGVSQREMAIMLGRSPKTISKILKELGIKTRRKRRGMARTTRRKRGGTTRIIRLTIPRQTAKLKVALNPALSLQQLKYSAKEGFYGLLGYVISNAIASFFTTKMAESGRTLNLGPLSTSTVVSGIVAIGLPFLPFHFAKKTSVLIGTWINFLARVAKDILPSTWRVREFLPAGSLGEIAQLPPPYYDEQSIEEMEQYYPEEETGYYPEETGYYPEEEVGYYPEETGEYYE